jgi:hypothetical protein
MKAVRVIAAELLLGVSVAFYPYVWPECTLAATDAIRKGAFR